MFQRLLMSATLIGVTAALATGCAEEDGQDAAIETDGAFIVEMTAHHESALQMAEMAKERAQHPEIRRLGREILATQRAEIDQLETIHQTLFAQPVAEGEHGTLGLQPHESGMGMDQADLDTAKPFDRAFIDMMVLHHQGAIRMARVQLDEGLDAGLKALSRRIISTQSREIEQMNAWREQWYGAPSPAGGVPAEGESDDPSHDAMGH
jgi:uncharacterized protein (DUF305 family)